jgi:hypothetical protein
MKKEVWPPTGIKNTKTRAKKIDISIQQGIFTMYMIDIVAIGMSTLAVVSLGKITSKVAV